MQRSPDIPGLTDLIQIGQGGNGIVYRATQTQLRRVVAVKLLTTRLDEVSAQRFALEGQALGSVSGHPNIVPIYTADTTADGTPYIIMLLCENGSLSDRLARGGPLSVPAVLDLGIRMSGALQTAHDAGLLHRDIKPGNILFDSYDVPRLADFGQARMADTNLTRTGDVVATPGFAAPEVLTGERATIRSDVYSLATTLSAALIGRGPFQRDDDENIAALLLRVVQEPPPDLRPFGVPDALAGELARAMDKQPGRRPMSAGELGRRLQDVQAALSLPHTPMIVAGEAAAHSPLAPRQGLPLDSGTRPIDNGYGAPATALLADPAVTPTRSVRPKRSRRVWVAVGITLAMVAGLGTWALASMLSNREPTNPTNASDLLIGSSGYGPGSWQATGDLNLLTSVLGSFPESAETAEQDADPTSLMQCMGLDPLTEIVSSKASAQYVDLDGSELLGGDELGASYRIARSQALVATSAETATSYVTAWSSPQFDTCLDEASGLGISVGKESTVWNHSPRISVPEHQPDVPSAVTFQARVVEIPLRLTSDQEKVETDAEGKDIQSGSRYVTIMAMSAGTSVAYVVMQSGQPGVPTEMIDAVAEAFADLATA